MPDDIFSRLNWQNEDSTATRTLPESIKHWLFWQDSLTQKLKQYCTEFEVKVRSEKWLNKMAENETALLPSAKTLIAAELFNSYTELGQLGTMPLGEWLFAQTWERQQIQWAVTPESGLWARRSLFFIQQKPLLIAELFLESSPITD